MFHRARERLFSWSLIHRRRAFQPEPDQAVGAKPMYVVQRGGVSAPARRLSPNYQCMLVYVWRSLNNWMCSSEI